MRNLFLSGVCALALTGCAVGPDFVRPALNLPAQWLGAGAATVAEPQVTTEWWALFSDQTLNTLMQQALAKNGDLKVARARVEEARGLRLQAQSTLLPGIDATGSIGRGRTTPTAATRNSREATLDAAWELDLFGGNRRAAESARATLAATRASEKFVRVSLLAEVARSYLNVRLLQNQLALAETRQTNQRRVLDIITLQAKEGVVNALDLNRAVSEQATIAADAPVIRASLAAAQNSLGVLVGAQPAEVQTLLGTASTIPVPSVTLALGTPANVILHRPDVQVAEHQLHAAVANVGVAQSQWFPRLSIGSLFGFSQVASAGVGSIWNVSGQAAVNLIDFGAIRGQVRTADARAQAALATYEQTVLTAVADVETALAGTMAARNQLDEVSRDYAAAESLKTLMQKRYDAGLASRLNLLSAEQAYVLAGTRYASAQAGVGTALANLYTALGGALPATAEN